VIVIVRGQEDRDPGERGERLGVGDLLRVHDVEGPRLGGALDGPGRLEVDRFSRCQREVEEDAQGLGRDDRAEDVGRSGGILPGQGVVLDLVGKDAPFGDQGAECVLEKAKAYMVVLVSLISRRASVRVVVLPWSRVSLSSRIARR